MCVTRINPRLVLLLVLVVAGVESQADARPKTDVLVMKNGDRITCELKSLSKGQLQIKTAYTLGTVTVNWDQVERIESTQLFRLETSSAEFRTGTIRQESDPANDQLAVEVAEGLNTSEVSHEDVVRIDQLATSLWDSLDGSIDIGLSYTSNNSTGQLNINAGLERRGEHNELDLAWSSLLNRVKEGENTSRYNGQAMFKRLSRLRRWYYGGMVDFLRSDQQNLELRVTPAAVLGRYLVRSNRSELLVLGGGAVNQESFLQPVDGVTDLTSAEGVIGSSLSIFRFDSTQIDSRLLFYPSITQSGRYRIDFNNSVYLDLWGDFYLRFTFYDNFDSRPQGDTPKNDLGMTTSFGWSF